MKSTNQGTAARLLVVLLLLRIQSITSFSSLSATTIHPHSHAHRYPTTNTILSDSKAIDVEFTRNDGEDDDDESSSSTKNPSSPPTPRTARPQSTLQASLNMIEPHLRIPIEFTDRIAQTFIPCSLAFVLDHDGVEYAIGTPIHTQVAVYCENDNGASYFLDPDLDDNLELMEMAAAKFESSLNTRGKKDCKLIFQRTPRTLTVQGDLDRLIQGWKVQDHAPKPSDVVNVLDEDEEDEFFDAFFQKELGRDYQEKYLNDDDPEMDAQVRQLLDAGAFAVPGIGSEKNDEDGLMELLEEIEVDLQISKQHPDTWDGNGNDEVEQALRLVGFEGPDGKPYSLVKMLQPTILVAKNDEDLAPDQRFLLTREEADEIIPVIENEFMAELSDAGLSIAKYYNSEGQQMGEVEDGLEMESEFE